MTVTLAYHVQKVGLVILDDLFFIAYIQAANRVRSDLYMQDNRLLPGRDHEVRLPNTARFRTVWNRGSMTTTKPPTSGSSPSAARRCRGVKFGGC